MRVLYLRYDVGRDRLTARVEPSPSGDTLQVQRDKIVLAIDPAQKAVVSFDVLGFRHFVNYHLLDEIFGEDVVRQIAAFQSAVVATARKSQRIQAPAPPKSSRRVVEQLLKAA